MSVVDLDIVDDLAIAAEVTGLDTEIISRVAQLNLADSALHAPAASRENEELIQALLTRPRCLLSVWPRTTLYPTAARGRLGWR